MVRSYVPRKACLIGIWLIFCENLLSCTSPPALVGPIAPIHRFDSVL
jgi:hypothetical protein